MTDTPTKWNPPQVAAPIGKYSHLTTVPAKTQLMFIAGQVGNDATGKIAAGDSYAQTIAAFRNVDRLLDSVGVGPQNIVRLLSFVSGTEHLAGYFAARDEIYAEWFARGDYPGHSLAVVSALASPEFTVELEGWAAIPVQG